VKKVCAAGETVKGLDVSHYQPHIDWQAVKASGHEFAFIKATDGLSRIDPLFEKHRAGARAAGLMVGAYHFFRPLQDAAKQAEFHARVVGQLDDNDLPCVLDFEVTDGAPGHDDVVDGLTFLRAVKKLTGKNPIVYCGPYFFHALGNGVDMYKEYPLWVAHYGTKCPLVPAPWSAWSFHQFSDKGHVPGVSGDGEDANLFNGSLEQLKKMTLRG
jgi:lysozyme